VARQLTIVTADRRIAVYAVQCLDVETSAG
jgi:hypothetical protein